MPTVTHLTRSRASGYQSLNHLIINRRTVIVLRYSRTFNRIILN